MKIRCINLTKTKKHQLSFDSDAGTDKAVTWIIGALDSRIMAHIKDNATAIPMSAFSGENSDATATLNLNKTNFDIVVFGLKGWENLLDDTDKPVVFKTAHTSQAGKTYLTADPELIAMLPSEVIDELAQEIMEINTLKEEERKNSDE